MTPGFSERLWTPVWVYLAAVVVSFAIAAAIWATSTGSIEGPLLFGMGLSLLFWIIIAASTTFRRIHTDGIYLRLGYGEKIDLRWVQRIEVVHGNDVRAIRHRLLSPSLPSAATGPALTVGQLGLAAGQLSMAWSSLRGLRTRAGLICAAWMHDGVYIATLPGQRTAEWLIGSRRPEELADALRQTVAAAQASIPAAEPQPA